MNPDLLAKLRMECLKLAAIKMPEGADPSQMISKAKALEEYVTSVAKADKLKGPAKAA